LEVFFSLVVQVGVIHLTADLLMFEKHSWKKAGKIVFIEILYNIALMLSVYMFYFVLGTLSPALGQLTGGLMRLLGTVYIF
jgi:hypothetical protein